MTAAPLLRAGLATGGRIHSPFRGPTAYAVAGTIGVLSPKIIARLKHTAFLVANDRKYKIAKDVLNESQKGIESFKELIKKITDSSMDILEESVILLKSDHMATFFNDDQNLSIQNGSLRFIVEEGGKSRLLKTDDIEKKCSSFLYQRTTKRIS